MKKNIMIVEDEEDQANILKIILEGEGYGVLKAKDAKECLEQLEKESPDLILMDIIMPGMYGTELLESLKQDAKTQDIPVIVTTIVSPMAGIEEDVRKIAPDAGFLPKPVSREQLLTKVREFLKNG